MNKEIIVIGGNHHNTLAILRSLGEKGLKVQLVVVSHDKKPYVSYSKYINEFIVIETEDNIREALHHLHKSKDNAIVIACSDAISSYLDCHRDELSSEFILPGSIVQGSITELMNKEVMARVASESGINVPKSWIVNISEPEIDDISYPCIIKPLISKEGSKADIEICTCRAELESYINEGHCKKVQIQEYILKDIEFQLIGCSLNGGEIVVIPGASIILRQPKNTNTGFLKYVPRKKINFDENACVNFIRKTCYSGLFSLEFLRDKEGNDYFMEINFRNDGNSICVTASGINLPYIWYLYNCGKSFEEELNYDRMKEVLVMPEFNDVGNAIHRRISLWQWLKDVKNTDRFMEFSKHDQKPFWMYIAKRLFKI